jgi:Na+-driven multidrug efflux pump
MLLFAPALGFGIAALVASALAFGSGARVREETMVRNRVAITVAVVAACLCALSLLAGAGLLVLDVLGSAAERD